MSDLFQVQNSVLNQIIEKSKEKKLNWDYDDKEKSCRTSIGEYIIHIDLRKTGMVETIKVWMFDPKGEIIDQIDIANPKKIGSGGAFESFFEPLYSIVNFESQRHEINKMSPLLDALKKL